MAEGVKGLLIAKSETFVVWALRREAESRRTWSGFGGLSIAGVVEALEMEERNVLTKIGRAHV